MMDADIVSIWTYENGAPEQFSLMHLCEVVEAHFGVPCKLVKMAEGGYHKVCAYTYLEGMFTANAKMISGLRYYSDRRRCAPR